MQLRPKAWINFKALKQKAFVVLKRRWYEKPQNREASKIFIVFKLKRQNKRQLEFFFLEDIESLLSRSSDDLLNMALVHMSLIHSSTHTSTI